MCSRFIEPTAINCLFADSDDFPPRGHRMLLVLKAGAQEVGREAARIVANAVKRNPALRLGLATGKTMVGMYQELVRLHRDENLNFSGVLTFNLDEYLGLAPNRSEEHTSELQSLAYLVC